LLFNCLQEEIVVLIFTVAADLWSVFGRNLQYGFSLATHVGSYLRPVKEVERLDSLLVWSTSALRVRQGTLMDPSCWVSGTSATQILCLSHQNPNMSPLEGSHGDRLPASDAVSEDYPRWPQAQLRLVEASVIDGCSAPPPLPRREVACLLTIYGALQRRESTSRHSTRRARKMKVHWEGRKTSWSHRHTARWFTYTHTHRHTWRLDYLWRSKVV